MKLNQIVVEVEYFYCFKSQPDAGSLCKETKHLSIFNQGKGW